MEIKEFTFRLMQLGVPGICCYFLLKKLIGKVGSDIFEAVLSIFVLSILGYFLADLFVLLRNAVDCSRRGVDNGEFVFLKGLFGDNSKVDGTAILYGSLGSPFVAALVSLVYRKKIWNRICQKLGVTNRYGDEDVFNYLLDAAQQTPRWYIVRDHKKELVYYGAITSWSDEGTDRELILEQVDVYSNEGDARLLYASSLLYLCRKRDDISIEILPPLADDKVNSAHE